MSRSAAHEGCGPGHDPANNFRRSGVIINLDSPSTRSISAVTTSSATPRPHGGSVKFLCESTRLQIWGSGISKSLRARQQASNATYILPIVTMWPYYGLPISAIASAWLGAMFEAQVSRDCRYGTSYQIATSVAGLILEVGPRSAANPRTPIHRGGALTPDLFWGVAPSSSARPCLVFVDTLDRMPGFAQSQQKSPAQDRASSAAAAIGSQTSDRLPNVAKSPRQYHRRDAGRPLLRQAMRLPPRA